MQTKQFVLATRDQFEVIHSTMDLQYQGMRALQNEYTSLFAATDIQIKSSILMGILTKSLAIHILRVTTMTQMIQFQQDFLEIIRDLQTGKLSPKVIPPAQLRNELEKIQKKLANYKPRRQLLFKSLWRYYADFLVTHVTQDAYLWVFLSVPTVNRESMC